MTKKKEIQPQREFIFKKGDVVMSLDRKEIRLIMGTDKNNCYEYIYLSEHSFKDIFNVTHVTNKGDKCSQPASIVEKHFAYFEIK